jgi:hypothetical protein
VQARRGDFMMIVPAFADGSVQPLAGPDMNAVAARFKQLRNFFMTHGLVRHHRQPPVPQGFPARCGMRLRVCWYMV